MLCQLMAQNGTSWFLEDNSPVKSAALISNEIFNGGRHGGKRQLMGEIKKHRILPPSPLHMSYQALSFFASLREVKVAQRRLFGRQV